MHTYRHVRKAICVLLVAIVATAFCACTPKNEQEPVKTTVTLSISSKTLSVGETFELIATVNDDNAVSYFSTDERVATVDNAGKVTAISRGTAEIFAVAGTANAVCTIVVEKTAGEALSLNKTSATVRVGEKVTLYASPKDGSGVTWLSSDDGVATVADGVVKGVGVGKTIIHAWSNTQSGRCEITVVEQTSDIKDGYALVWNDEFDGNALDMTKWSYMTGVRDSFGESNGPYFWGNNEQQYYTEDAVTVSDGTLKITAKREDMDAGRSYSSARICTRNKGFWTYGYIEARIKLPAVEGMWPAFWMLPEPSSAQNTRNEYGSWAASGEIDIMEAKGRLAYNADTTLHFGNYGSSTYRTAVTKLDSPISEWHTYAIEWKKDSITWFIDGATVLTLTSDVWWSEAAPDSETAPFDTDFYILLNLAVGGNFDGGRVPDESFTSAAMEVDYVRVYAES